MSQQDLQQSIANLNNQMTQLLQAIQPLLAGAGAAPPVATTTPQPVIFILSPGTTYSDQLTEFFTCTAQSLYDAGRAKLMDDESERFNLNVSQVVRFQEMLHFKSQVMGWTNQTQEIVKYQVNGRNYDLISEYGQFPFDVTKS